MKVGIACETINYSVEELLKEFKKQGVDVFTFSIKSLLYKIGFDEKVLADCYRIDDLDCILIRSIPPGSSE